MRLLLDSRDLIDIVEHGRPVTATVFDAYLRANNHQLVFSFTNVREFSGPLAAGVGFLRLWPFLQALESMPHLYLKEATIIPAEIEAAAGAFNAGTVFQSPSPYVPRWDHVLVVDPRRHTLATANWVNFRLDEIIYYLSRASRQVFAPPSHHIAQLRTQLENDRTQLRLGKAPSRLHLSRSIAKHAATHRIALPSGRENEFGDWVYQDPHRLSWPPPQSRSLPSSNGKSRRYSGSGGFLRLGSRRCCPVCGCCDVRSQNAALLPRCLSQDFEAGWPTRLCRSTLSER